MRAPIGIKIRNRRKSLGISQAHLAQSINISASYLNLIEANKRQVGGTLLHKIAAELSLSIEELSGAAEQRLIQNLEEVLAEPIFVQSDLQPSDAQLLVGEHPKAAQAIVAIHQAYSDANTSLDVYAQRLQADPLFAELLHQILNHVSAVRSSSEIMTDIPDLADADRDRFIKTIYRESGAISDVAATLIAHFEQSSQTRRMPTPAREVDDLILTHQNYFPALEDAAQKLRQELDQVGPFNENTITQVLNDTFNIQIQRGGSPPNQENGFANQYQFNATSRIMWFQGSTTAATRQFQLARLYGELRVASEINAHIAVPELTSAASRRLAYRAMTSYLAGAIVLPYTPFLEAAEANAYDIDYLSQNFTAGFEQVAHRLVTLRRPNEEGIPFAFLRSDPAGRLTKHFPLPGLMLPNSGHACPLWAIYAAFRAPDQVVRQTVKFANESRYLFIAKTVTKRLSTFQDQPFHSSVMLATEILNADRTVYGQGLNLQDQTRDIPVGPACRLCVRRGCAHRQEEALDLVGAETDLRRPFIPRQFEVEKNLLGDAS